MKLLSSTENKITKFKNIEQVPYLEINEVVLVLGNMPAIIINMIQESCIHLFPINHLVNF